VIGVRIFADRSGAYGGGCTVTTANIPDDLIVVADAF
jgi:hypothetical protein